MLVLVHCSYLTPPLTHKLRPEQHVSSHFTSSSWPVFLYDKKEQQIVARLILTRNTPTSWTDMFNAITRLTKSPTNSSRQLSCTGGGNNRYIKWDRSYCTRGRPCCRVGGSKLPLYCCWVIIVKYSWMGEEVLVFERLGPNSLYI